MRRTNKPKTDLTHRPDPKQAEGMIQKAKRLFAPERGRWVRVDAKTLKFQFYK